MRWAGVDVGGGRKGFDVAVIESRGPELQLVWLRREGRVENVKALLVEVEPTVIAIDSPIAPALPGCLSRDCEKEVARAVCGIRYTPNRVVLEAHPHGY